MNILAANPFQSWKQRNHQFPSLLRYGQKKITLCNILFQDQNLIKNIVPLFEGNVEQNILKKYQIKMLQYNKDRLTQPPINSCIKESKEKCQNQGLTNFQKTVTIKNRTIPINPFQTNHAIEKNIEQNTILINKHKYQNVNKQIPINQHQFTRKQIMRLRNEIKDKEKQNKTKQSNSVINLYKYKRQLNQPLNSSKDRPFDKSITFTLLQSSYLSKIHPL